MSTGNPIFKPTAAQMHLRTRRFLLREFEAADRDSFIRYQEELGLTVLQADALLERFAGWSRQKPRCNWQFAITEQTGALIGCAGIRKAGHPEGCGEFGIELAPDRQGLYGCAVEVTDALLAFAFDDLGLQRIVGRTTVDNPRAAKLALLFGGNVRQARADNVAAVEWVITASAWRGARVRLKTL